MSDSVLASPSPIDNAEALLLGRRRRSGVPALGAVVLSSGGIVWSGVNGVRRRTQEVPATLSDVWHIGSNAKAMTAAVYARLVQADLAAWSTPLPTLFPDIEVHRTWARVTAADMLHHRSGLRDRGLADARWIRAARLSPASAAEQRMILARSALTVPPKGQVGRFSYANANYVLIGAAVERLLAQSWESAIAAWLFRPLGMSSAGFGAPRGDQPWGHVGSLMGLQVGKPVDPARPDADNPAFMGPAGAAHMSLLDHARFVRLFLTDGAGFLTRPSITALTTPPTGEPNDYAFGWGVMSNRAWARGPVLAHEGSNTLWHAVAIVAPSRDLAVLTVCNAGGPGGRAAQGLALDLVRRYAPEP